MKLLTIIIPNLNHGRYLKTCIESIRDASDARQVEVFIVDGGSTDNSLEISSKLENVTMFLRPDLTLVDSINFGMSISSSKYCAWVSSSDFVRSSSLCEVLSIIDREDFDMGYFGGGHYASNIGKVVPHNDCLTLSSRISFVQPGLIWSTQFLKKIGYLNNAYRLAFDLDLVTRSLKTNSKVFYKNVGLGINRIHFDSLTANNIEHWREASHVLNTAGLNIPFKWYLYQCIGLRRFHHFGFYCSIILRSLLKALCLNNSYK